MMFDPNESIQLQGFTAPFIQNAHARIKSLIRKADSMGLEIAENDIKKISSMESVERDVIIELSRFENKIREAAKDYSPAIIANFAFDLAKQYNQFYQNIPIFKESDIDKLKFRMAFSKVVAGVIKKSMGMLGIAVPEKM